MGEVDWQPVTEIGKFQKAIQEGQIKLKVQKPTHPSSISEIRSGGSGVSTSNQTINTAATKASIQAPPSTTISFRKKRVVKNG